MLSLLYRLASGPGPVHGEGRAPGDLPTAGGSYANRDVILVASLHGQTWVRARVEYDDQGGTAPGDKVIVKSWTSDR